MCGIFGCQLEDWALTDGRRVLLTTSLASLNDSRGGHSWGLVKLPGVPFGDPEEESAGEPDEVQVARGLGEVSDHVEHLIGATSFFGHTRFATVGDRTVENAHPFEIGKILGAHNGAVWNHAEMAKKYNRNFSVDSMHIFGHLDSDLPFDELEGYGAIVWIEKDNPKRIYLCKLRGGDLSVWGLGKYKSNIQGVVFSSDRTHLKYAMARARITDDEYFMYNVEMGHVYFIENAMFYDGERELTIATRTGGTTCGANTTWRGYQGTWDGDDGEYGREKSKGRKHHGRFQEEEKTPLPEISSKVNGKSVETTTAVEGVTDSAQDAAEGMTKPNDLLHIQGR